MWCEGGGGGAREQRSSKKLTSVLDFSTTNASFEVRKRNSISTNLSSTFLANRVALDQGFAVLFFWLFGDAGKVEKFTVQVSFSSC